MNEMTNKMIKDRAKKLLKEHIVAAVISSLYLFSVLILIVLLETIIFIGLRLLGVDHHIFSLRFYVQNPIAVLFLALRIAGYYAIFSTQAYIARRSVIGFANDDKTLERYLAAHLRLLLMPSLKCSMQLAGLKILVLSPAAFSAYGIAKSAQIGSSGKISIAGLFIFMLCIGFTIVWIGVCIHYFMSLSLVKYILVLNPRTEFFAACDLSIRLMEGKHYRVMMFYFSFIPFLPAVLLIYPCLVILPYFMDCRMILAKEIMGVHWQDKLPAMARRWEKRQRK